MRKLVEEINNIKAELSDNFSEYKDWKLDSSPVDRIKWLKAYHIYLKQENAEYLNTILQQQESTEELEEELRGVTVERDQNCKIIKLKNERIRVLEEDIRELKEENRIHREHIEQLAAELYHETEQLKFDRDKYIELYHKQCEICAEHERETQVVIEKEKKNG